MIKGILVFLILANNCCTNITHAADENSSPENSPFKKAGRSEQRPVSNLTPLQRAYLKEAGFSEKRLLLINIAQTAFYRTAMGPTLEASSYFDSDELNKIFHDLERAQDTNPLETLRQLIFNLKTLYLDPVPLSCLPLNKTTIHTPSVRLAFNTDKEAIEACKTIVDKTLLKSVTGLTYKEPDEEALETPEERAARKKMQAETFKKIELERGISEKSLTAQNEQTYNVWKKYFYYIEKRKHDIDVGVSPKIKACEIEDMFNTLVSSFYSTIEVKGWTLFFNKNEIDLNRYNSFGVRNLVLLMKGEAPIGADGKPMNLHHLTRRQPGIIVLLPGSFHTKYTGLLHLRSEQHMKQPEAVNRHHFTWWKEHALKALGEHLRSSVASMVAKPITAQRRPANNMSKGIRTREVGQKESPTRVRVNTKLF